MPESGILTLCNTGRPTSTEHLLPMRQPTPTNGFSCSRNPAFGSMGLMHAWPGAVEFRAYPLPFRHPVHRAISLGLVCLTLFLVCLAASPELHARFHPDQLVSGGPTDNDHGGDDDHCVVRDFAKGASDLPVFAVFQLCRDSIRREPRSRTATSLAPEPPRRRMPARFAPPPFA